DLPVLLRARGPRVGGPVPPRAGAQSGELTDGRRAACSAQEPKTGIPSRVTEGRRGLRRLRPVRAGGGRSWATASSLLSPSRHRRLARAGNASGCCETERDISKKCLASNRTGTSARPVNQGQSTSPSNRWAGLRSAGVIAHEPDKKQVSCVRSVAPT